MKSERSGKYRGYSASGSHSSGRTYTPLFPSYSAASRFAPSAPSEKTNPPQYAWSSRETASRASFERARFMHLFQPDGYVSVDFMNARVKTYRKEKPVIESMNDVTVTYPKVEKQLPITAEILHFIACIKTAKTPAPSGEKGTKALDLALQICEKMNRFDIPKTGHLHTPKPFQAISSVARAAQAVLDETLGHLKGDDK